MIWGDLVGVLGVSMDRTMVMLVVKSKSNSQTSLPRAIGSPKDLRTVLLRAVGQPMIFGTPLVVQQRIKNSLSTVYRFGQSLNLMCVLYEHYISPLAWPPAVP